MHTINAFWQEIYSATSIEMIGVVRPETVDAGPSALLEWMKVPGTLMIDPNYFWDNSRTNDGGSTLWQDGFPLPRIGYSDGCDNVMCNVPIFGFPVLQSEVALRGVK
jgi:hypothetical protein